MAQPDTADRILDVAERLVQIHGYGGFSFADLATALEIRKPSVHHHFATKADLGRRLLSRYCERFAHALEQIERDEPKATRRLSRYAGLFADVLRDDHRLCLCGMLAAELASLPEGMRLGVREFFELNEHWLARVLTEGRKRGELGFRGAPRTVAARIVAAFEGAMLVARSYGEPARFDAHAKAILADLRRPG